MTKVVFRVDASLEIGTGHVIRCLTLADGLAARGVKCFFICREHLGNMLDLIRSKGHKVYFVKLQSQAIPQTNPGKVLAHSDWLGATQKDDVISCARILKTINPDWLIVDHYALDNRWEKALVPYYDKLMVIDDLADRSHFCDLLLDQNLGREEQDYKKLVPKYCKVLIGPQYALLRPEFSQLRDYSFKRRQTSQLKQLLITMGGVDKDNVTCMVLEALKGSSLPPDCFISIIMGPTAPWLEHVRNLASQMLWKTEIVVNANDMAQRMAAADLSIGAAGSTSWERCCLGLPSILLCLAENQSQVIRALEKCGASVNMELNELRTNGAKALQAKLDDIASRLPMFIKSAMGITDGEGTDLVCNTLLNRS